MSKNFKKYMVLVSFIFIFVFSHLTNVEGQTPNIIVNMIGQDPDPVTPGRYVELRFVITNTRPESRADNFEVRLEPKFPFFLDESEENLQRFAGFVNSGTRNSLNVKYKVRVANDAVEGVDEIGFLYRYSNGKWITRYFDVDIQTLDSNLEIRDVVSVPSKILPGEEADFTITIKNMADSRVNDVSLKLDLTYSAITGEGGMNSLTDKITAYNSLPFVPVGSGNEQSVKFIEAGEEVNFTYRLRSYPDAEVKVYKIPIILSFADELEQKHEKKEVIGLVVGSLIDTKFLVDSVEDLGNDMYEVSLKFVNVGRTDIKSLNVELTETSDYYIDSSREVYVGDVDSDDFQVARFVIMPTFQVTEMPQKKVNLPLNVSYRDPNNEKYTVSYELPVRIRKTTSNGGPGSLTIIIGIIVLLVLGYFIYKRVKKRARMRKRV